MGVIYLVMPGGGAMVPTTPARKGEVIFSFLDGGVEYIKAGNNFYYLDYKVS